MASPGRHSSDDALVAALAGGLSYAEAGQRAHVSERTVSRRMESPDFRQRVTAARAGYLERATARLAATAAAAASVLATLLLDTDPRVRLGAARSVLGSAVALRDATELAAEVARLREAVDALTERSH